MRGQFLPLTITLLKPVKSQRNLLNGFLPLKFYSPALLLFHSIVVVAISGRDMTGFRETIKMIKWHCV